MRPQEYLVLPVTSLQDGGVRITQALDRSNKIGPPKTKAGRRFIPLSSTVLDIVRHYIDGQGNNGLVLYHLQDGLRKASAIALSLGLDTEAAAIALRAPHKRPDTWSFRDHFADQYVFPFLFDVALTTAIKGKEVRERDILPKELVPIGRGMKGNVSGAEFRKNLKQRLEKLRATRDASGTDEKKITYDQKRERSLGKTSETATYLAKVHPRFAQVRAEHNDHINYHGRSYERSLGRNVANDRQNKTKLQKILNDTTPTDEISLGKAISDLDQINDVYSLREISLTRFAPKCRTQRGRYTYETCPILRI